MSKSTPLTQIPVAPQQPQPPPQMMQQQQQPQPQSPPQYMNMDDGTNDATIQEALQQLQGPLPPQYYPSLPPQQQQQQQQQQPYYYGSSAVNTNTLRTCLAIMVLYVVVTVLPIEAMIACNPTISKIPYGALLVRMLLIGALFYAFKSFIE
jgi:hypothetical protein